MIARLKIRTKTGFTLIEILVVILVVGILTVLAVPQYYKTIERDKATEAANLFFSLQGAQDRYKTKYGVYCNADIAACPGFDVTPPSTHYFNAIPAFAAGGAGNQSWTLTLTRTDAPMPYGAYQMKYDIEPGASPVFTCDQPSCVTDLLPKQ